MNLSDILPLIGMAAGGYLGGEGGAAIGGGVGSVLGGRSLTGTPAQMTSTSGPLTSEGQQLWNMVMGQTQNTSPTKSVNFGGNNWTIQNPGYNNLLNMLMKIDSSRGGATPFTPDQGGVLAGLAPVLGAMAGSNKKTNTTGSSSLGSMGGVTLQDILKGLSSYFGNSSSGTDLADVGYW